MTELGLLATLLPIIDETPMPVVKRECERCGVETGDAIVGRVIVSPRGTAHYADHESTRCGIDATGDKWWWPL